MAVLGQSHLLYPVMVLVPVLLAVIVIAIRLQRYGWNQANVRIWALIFVLVTAATALYLWLVRA